MCVCVGGGGGCVCVCMACVKCLFLFVLGGPWWVCVGGTRKFEAELGGPFEQKVLGGEVVLGGRPDPRGAGPWAVSFRTR